MFVISQNLKRLQLLLQLFLRVLFKTNYIEKKQFCYLFHHSIKYSVYCSYCYYRVLRRYRLDEVSSEQIKLSKQVPLINDNHGQKKLKSPIKHGEYRSGQLFFYLSGEKQLFMLLCQKVDFFVRFLSTVSDTTFTFSSLRYIIFPFLVLFRISKRCFKSPFLSWRNIIAIYVIVSKSGLFRSRPESWTSCLNSR